MVFQLLERDGPLSLSIYTGTRKIISIFLSIFWFEKHITHLQKFSLALGVFIMLMELFDKTGFSMLSIFSIFSKKNKTNKSDSFSSVGSVDGKEDNGYYSSDANESFKVKKN